MESKTSIRASFKWRTLTKTQGWPSLPSPTKGQQLPCDSGTTLAVTLGLCMWQPGAPSPSPTAPRCADVCLWSSLSSLPPRAVISTSGYRRHEQVTGGDIGNCSSRQSRSPSLCCLGRSPVERSACSKEKDNSTFPEVRLIWCLYMPQLPNIALALPLADLK